LTWHQRCTIPSAPVAIIPFGAVIGSQLLLCPAIALGLGPGPRPPVADPAGGGGLNAQFRKRFMSRSLALGVSSPKRRAMLYVIGVVEYSKSLRCTREEVRLLTRKITR
jgi:hypothetical protein